MEHLLGSSTITRNRHKEFKKSMTKVKSSYNDFEYSKFENVVEETYFSTGGRSSILPLVGQFILSK